MAKWKSIKPHDNEKNIILTRPKKAAEEKPEQAKVYGRGRGKIKQTLPHTPAVDEVCQSPKTVKRGPLTGK